MTTILLNERLRNVCFSKGESGMVNDILFVLENIAARMTFKVIEEGPERASDNERQLRHPWALNHGSCYSIEAHDESFEA